MRLTPVRIVTTLVAVAATLLPLGSAYGADTAAQPGQMVERTLTNAAGTRTYFLYEPTVGGAGRPLMVWLHGCGGPGIMQAGHALARVAEARGFALVYPVQDPAASPVSCWNWFQAASQHRGSGEASILADITTTTMNELGSDTRRIYVGGYSAGGAMTSVMGAAYPDLYAAIAPSAGAPYGFDPTGAAAYKEMGARARPVPAFLLQGVLDEISVYPVGRTNLLQWLGTDDFADDGASNRSVPRLPSSVRLLPLGVGVLAEDYRSGGCHLARFVTSPLDHLLAGALFYSDAGLALQQTMMDFLLAHRLGSPGQGCG